MGDKGGKKDKAKEKKQKKTKQDKKTKKQQDKQKKDQKLTYNIRIDNIVQVLDKSGIYKTHSRYEPSQSVVGSTQNSL